MKKTMFLCQILSLALLIISVSAMGAEIFINDLENAAALKVWGIIAIISLNANALICIWRLWKNGSGKEKTAAIFLLAIIIIFWLTKII